MKYNWRRQRLSTENTPIPYSNTLHLECWSFTTTSLRDSVTSTNLRSWKWTLTFCIWHCQKKSCTIAFEKNLKLINWKLMRTEVCKDDFRANATTNFFPRTCCTKHMKHDKPEPGLFKEEFRCTEMLCLCSKIYCYYESNSNKYKISSKGSNKITL